MGVMIRSDLRWDDQVRSATQKARVAAHSIAKAFISKDITVWSDLFRTFVRPHIEYAMPAWLPYQSNHLKTLESMQRWFSRQIPGIGHLDYLERYRICGLQTVEVRRDRGVIIETFKLTTGINSTCDRMIQPHGHNYDTRGRKAGNLSHVKPHGDVRKFSFAARAPILWDAVPFEAKNAVSVNSFKNLLDSMTFEIAR